MGTQVGRLRKPCSPKAASVSVAGYDVARGLCAGHADVIAVACAVFSCVVETKQTLGTVVLFLLFCYTTNCTNR